MKLLTVLFLFSISGLHAQINPKKITIARDSFGVPHVFAPADPEVAYGIAWAHAEDDFETLQLVVLTGKAKLGTGLGRKGAEADYVINLLRIRQVVEEQWSSLSPDFLALVSGYVEGLNAYARAHPKQIKYKKAFPFNEKEYLTAVVFSVSLFCGVDDVLPKIFGGKVEILPGFSTEGSNAFALNSRKTGTNETFLVINAHQPLEGPVAFYEAHLQSEQGWNMLGGLFPGGCLIFHGTNENLGWAHTVNYQDKLDVYQLEMNPANTDQYKFDGEWQTLETRKVKLKVKGIPVTIGKKAYWSKYGATIKTANGVFSIRVPATMDIKALEQWYRMNKAKNFSEFYSALEMTSLPMFNITYADRYDTIFYISNGKMPRRNPDPRYKWKSTVPGNTSATLWETFKPVKDLPQLLNPASGYLYNTNHSPFLATASPFNPDPGKSDPNDGYEMYHNNRSKRVTELLEGKSIISYETLRKIKFDRQLPLQLQYPYGIDSMLLLEEKEYPALQDVIRDFRNWDRVGHAESKGAAVFLLVYDHVSRVLAGTASRQLTMQESIAAYQYAHDHMHRYFGKTGIVLGDIQKLVRGNDARPAGGLPDVLTAAYTVPFENGERKIISGDAYICFVRYPANGLPFIESVNTFGASMNQASPHYKDQMDMFLQQRTKRMTLDKGEVLRNAIRVYSPGD